MVNICDLPPEVILLIFQFYAETEGQKALISRVSRVCSLWKDICMNKILWIKVDDTVSFKNIMLLSKMGCLDNTKDLNISLTNDLNCGNAEKLFSKLKNLEVLNLLHMQNFSKETFSIIASNCCKLKAVRIESVQLERTIPFSYTLLDSFFALRGTGITAIEFSYCRIGNLQLFVRCVADCCPNLEKLLLRYIYCSSRTFPTQYFQEHCSKLRILHLDKSVIISDKRYSLGFPKLEVFTYIDNDFKNLTDENFSSVVFNSPELKFLNLTYCDISAEVLCTIPASSVEYLYIAKSKIINQSNLGSVFKKWCHSLKEVDISYSTDCCINKAVCKLILSPAKSQLQILNLNFTKVLASVIEQVLSSCVQLEVLSVEGCRNLERGMKKSYNGKTELNILRKRIETYFSNNPSEKYSVSLD